MAGQWTYGKRLGIGFALAVALTVATGAVAVYSLRDVVDSKDHVIRKQYPLVVDAERSRAAVERKGGALRGFLLTRDESLVTQLSDADRELTTSLQRIRAGLDVEATRRAFEPIGQLALEYQQAVEKVIALRRTDATLDAVAKSFEETVLPKRQQVDSALASLVQAQTQSLETSRVAANDAVSYATTFLIVIVVIAVLLGIVLAALLARTLSRQIGTAVGQVQSSSAELQAAADRRQPSPASTRTVTASSEPELTA